MFYLGETRVVLGRERALQKKPEIIERVAPAIGLVRDIRLQDCRSDRLAYAVAIFDVPGQARGVGETLGSKPLQNLLLRIRARFQPPVDLHHEAIAEIDSCIILRRRTRDRCSQIGTIASENAAERSRVRPGKFPAQSAHPPPA